MLMNFLIINAMHNLDIERRNGLPLGDANWNGSLIKAQEPRRPVKRRLIDEPLSL